ncbi:Uma2 family endonuclease [Gemmata sp.]|uniref:Uma2 family endonuclease n=1 Tax=Gemmata sp. TaxID=1914242 RepID=UPI003F72116C
MPAPTKRQRAAPATFAELHAKLGGVPLDRILMNPPPDTASEADLLAAWRTPPHHRWELVEGTLVEKYGSFLGGVTVGALCGFLGNWLDATDTGAAFIGNVAYRLRPGLIRSPSLSYIPWERFPNGELPDEEVSSVVPALVIEVPNETNTPEELARKIADYFAAGARLAWVIDPRAKTAKAYTSVKKFKEFDESGTLDGGKVLPGFKLPLAQLFAVGKPRMRKPK